MMPDKYESQLLIHGLGTFQKIVDPYEMFSKRNENEAVTNSLVEQLDEKKICTEDISNQLVRKETKAETINISDDECGEFGNNSEQCNSSNKSSSQLQSSHQSKQLKRADDIKLFKFLRNY